MNENSYSNAETSFHRHAPNNSSSSKPQTPGTCCDPRTLVLAILPLGAVSPRSPHPGLPSVTLPTLCSVLYPTEQKAKLQHTSRQGTERRQSVDLVTASVHNRAIWRSGMHSACWRRGHGVTAAGCGLHFGVMGCSRAVVLRLPTTATL